MRLRRRARRLADRPKADHADAADKALKSDVRAAAEDDIRRVVAEERADLFVGHIVGDWLERIGRGPMDEDDLAAVLKGEPEGGREAGEALEDDIAELGSDLGEPVEARALVRAEVSAASVDAVDIERGERAIAGSLDADGVRLHEPAKGVEGRRARETEVAGDEDFVVAVSLGGREDSSEGVRVAMDVRDAEEPHQKSIEADAKLAKRVHLG